MTIHFTFIAFDKCLASGITGSIDLLHAANQIGGHLGKEEPLFSWQTASQQGTPVCSSSGQMLPVDCNFDQIGGSDIVFVGGLGTIDKKTLEGSIREISQTLSPMLRSHYACGTTIATFCTGSFLVAETGLLCGKIATTSWWLSRPFQKRYPEVTLDSDAMIIHSDRIVSAGAATSYQDLIIYLIKHMCDKTTAYFVTKYMILDGQRPSQAVYKTTELLEQDPDSFANEAKRWISDRIADKIRMEDLASHFGTSERTLVRRFQRNLGKSPQEYVQMIRIEKAKKLLVTTSLPVGSILTSIGYNDDSSFRKLFKRVTSLSPADYRRRYGLHAC